VDQTCRRAEIAEHFRPIVVAKKTLITGITGQDVSYLTELLLAKGYEVPGIVRRAAAPYRGYLDRAAVTGSNQLFLHHGDLADAGSLLRLLERIRPDEAYNLGAQSDVRISFDIPGYTADVTATGVARLLEAIHQLGLPVKFYQASSSEMFGKIREMPQAELTPFHPRSIHRMAERLVSGLLTSQRCELSFISASLVFGRRRLMAEEEHFPNSGFFIATGRLRYSNKRKKRTNESDASIKNYP
jgi:GDP-D-mannose dehydratase